LHRRDASLLEFCPICLLQGGDVSVDSVPRGALGIRELTLEFIGTGVVTVVVDTRNVDRGGRVVTCLRRGFVVTSLGDTSEVFCFAGTGVVTVAVAVDTCNVDRGGVVVSCLRKGVVALPLALALALTAGLLQRLRSRC
jgi:hypothetical protein